MLKFSSSRIISRGMRVFFIQNLRYAGSSNMKSIPAFSGRDSRYMSQRSFSFWVWAISI